MNDAKIYLRFQPEAAESSSIRARDFYFAFLPMSQAVAANLRHELLATGVFSPSGKQTPMGKPVDMQNKQKVLDALGLIFKRVGEVMEQLKTVSSSQS